MGRDESYQIIVAETYSPEAVARLREIGQVTVLEDSTPESILAAVVNADALLVKSKAHVTARIIDSAPKLKVIGRASHTIDHIDLRAISRRDIRLVYAPHAAVASTAEFALTLILATHRRIVFFDQQLRDGKFETVRAPNGNELSRRTVGLLGLDPVAERLGKILMACFGPRLIYHDPSGRKAKEFEAQEVGLDQLLAEADFVSMHLPSSPQTRGFMNAERLAKMKPTGALINVTRGGCVDGIALAEALRRRHLAGAALDVFEREPLPANHPLRKAPNCILTPHVGGATVDASEGRYHVAEDVVRVLQGQLPKYPYEVVVS